MNGHTTIKKLEPEPEKHSHKGLRFSRCVERSSVLLAGIFPGWQNQSFHQTNAPLARS